MWPNEKPRHDKSGNRWNFHYWYAGLNKEMGQRLFFWNEDETDYGVLLFPPDKSVPYKRIENLIANLVADSDLRKKHHRELKFPLKKYYEDYPVFPEEFSQ